MVKVRRKKKEKENKEKRQNTEMQKEVKFIWGKMFQQMHFIKENFSWL